MLRSHTVSRSHLVDIFVLDAVDFLQQIAKTVDENLLFERAQSVRAVRMMVHHADGRVRLFGVGLGTLVDHTVNDQRKDLALRAV